jgi:hypothetical protein
MNVKDHEKLEKAGEQWKTERVYRTLGACEVKIPDPSGPEEASFLIEGEGHQWMLL